MSCALSSKRISVRELKRESRVDARAGKSGSGQEMWAQTGVTQRDCDGKATTVDLSRARGKEERGLSWETERPGEAGATEGRK